MPRRAAGYVSRPRPRPGRGPGYSSIHLCINPALKPPTDDADDGGKVEGMSHLEEAVTWAEGAWRSPV